MILLIKDKRFHSTSIADRQLPFLDSRSAGWVAVALRRCNLSVKKIQVSLKEICSSGLSSLCDKTIAMQRL